MTESKDIVATKEKCEAAGCGTRNEFRIPLFVKEKAERAVQKFSAHAFSLAGDVLLSNRFPS